MTEHLNEESMQLARRKLEDFREISQSEQRVIGGVADELVAMVKRETIDLNAVEEEKKIQIEQSRMALVQAFSALSQSIPQLAAAGQDVTQVITAQAKFIKALSDGKTVEVAVEVAMAPPKPQTPPGAPGPPPAPSP